MRLFRLCPNFRRGNLVQVKEKKKKISAHDDVRTPLIRHVFALEPIAVDRSAVAARTDCFVNNQETPQLGPVGQLDIPGSPHYLTPDSGSPQSFGPCRVFGVCSGICGARYGLRPNSGGSGSNPGGAHISAYKYPNFTQEILYGPE